jgi:hypothetical protein
MIFYQKSFAQGLLSSTARLGYAKISLAQQLMIFYQKSFALGTQPHSFFLAKNE